ncbi:MAG TPA: hypothetical protein VHS55_06850 [Solirubrobacteraceae bacterium]|nr:hypothetical protein [Solirubrobacteraceae bacterium]
MSLPQQSTRRPIIQLSALEETLRAARADVVALRELSAALAQALDTLDAELQELAQQVRSESSEASTSADRPARSDDLDGARLVALNMALNGDSREAADRYLAENFDVPDRERLLDEVYAAIEG